MQESRVDQVRKTMIEVYEQIQSKKEQDVRSF